MKKIFWFGCLGLFLFEIATLYFIMPMPGSQRMNSIDLAYFLHTWRWIIRPLFGLMILAGLLRSAWKRKWLPAIPLAILGVVVYLANFKMAADAMFRQPKHLLTVTADKNKVDSNRLVIGIVINGQAKAYPIQFLGYHHQVQDEVGGQPILVTYCTVCRSGRVYEPIVNGKKETFRLVGMDHFNAMLEDAGTKSWWRQATGEAITGKLKGKKLPEVFSSQTSLAQWLRLHPGSAVMQADDDFLRSYSKNTKYEEGTSRDALTGTDSLSWNDKSWVIGIKAGNGSKAYDWNKLKSVRMIRDTINAIPLILLLAGDDKSFFAFQITDGQTPVLHKDTLLIGNRHFTVNGKGIDTLFDLKPLPAYQEFWHSWRTFNPGTRKY